MRYIHILIAQIKTALFHARSAPMATPGQQQLERALWARREPRQHISSVCSVGEGSGSIADEVRRIIQYTLEQYYL